MSKTRFFNSEEGIRLRANKIWQECVVRNLNGESYSPSDLLNQRIPESVRNKILSKVQYHLPDITQSVKQIKESTDPVRINNVTFENNFGNWIITKKGSKHVQEEQSAADSSKQFKADHASVVPKGKVKRKGEPQEGNTPEKSNKVTTTTVEPNEAMDAESNTTNVASRAESPTESASIPDDILDDIIEQMDSPQVEQQQHNLEALAYMLENNPHNIPKADLMEAEGSGRNSTNVPIQESNTNSTNIPVHGSNTNSKGGVSKKTKKKPTTSTNENRIVGIPNPALVGANTNSSSLFHPNRDLRPPQQVIGMATQPNPANPTVGGAMGGQEDPVARFELYPHRSHWQYDTTPRKAKVQTMTTCSMKLEQENDSDWSDAALDRPYLWGGEPNTNTFIKDMKNSFAIDLTNARWWFDLSKWIAYQNLARREQVTIKSLKLMMQNIVRYKKVWVYSDAAGTLIEQWEIEDPGEQPVLYKTLDYGQQSMKLINNPEQVFGPSITHATIFNKDSTRYALDINRTSIIIRAADVPAFGVYASIVASQTIEDEDEESRSSSLHC